MTWVGESSPSESGIMVFSSDGTPRALVGANNQVIEWIDGEPKFVPISSISGIPLNNISDVNTVGATSGDFLLYNGADWNSQSLSTVLDSELAAVYLISSTGINPLPPGIVDRRFDTVITSTNTDILELDSAGFHIDVKEAGTYEIGYSVEGKIEATDEIEFHIAVNQTMISGTHTIIGEHHHNSDHEYSMAKTAFLELDANDEVSLQMGHVVGVGSTVDAGYILRIASMKATKGDQGLVGLVGPKGASGSGVHGLLSDTHTDVQPASGVDGDIIYASGNTWTKLAAGINGQILALTAGRPVWEDNAADAVTISGVTATSDTSTTSVSFVGVPGMSGVPIAGEYEIKFLSSVNGTDKDQDIHMAIFKDGTIINYTEVRAQGMSGHYPIALFATDTLDGTNVVEVRWFSDTGDTAILHARSLHFTRIGS